MPKYDPKKMTLRDVMQLLTRLNVRLASYEEGQRPVNLPPGGKVIHRGSYMQRGKYTQPKEIFIDFVLYGEMPKEIDLFELREICRGCVDLFQNS
ncbi:MAG TPA: hypothetical protein VIO61_12960 [Anaerolineaceae bacterium]